MTLMFNGIGVSRGIAIGKVHKLHRDVFEIREQNLSSQEIPAEIERFKGAVETAKNQLHDISDNIPLTLNVEISAFIETHLLMLDDDILAEGTTRIIRDRQCNAEWALRQQMDTIGQVFDAMEDDYLATRKNDINHVIQRILRALHNLDRPDHEIDIQLWQGKIVLADDLTPSDTILMQHGGVAGFITESGGPLSHTAILARSLDIPAVVGVHEAHRYIRDGEMTVVDGILGLVLADPPESGVDHFAHKQYQFLRKRRELTKIKDAPSRTMCGTDVVLQANIESEEDIAALHQVNAAGVGLYRTEFLYLRRSDIPSEEEHYENYSTIVRALAGAPLTIRTVDLGSDKEMDYERSGLPAHNPALGLRGVRRCLSDPPLFLPQLRALLRASAEGPIKILLPMLTNVDEVIQVRRVIEEAKSSLRSRGQTFDDNIPIGGMIEVPASAISARQFSKYLDFFAIGTNDLIQYTLAIDRIDDQVNYLYDPLNPAVLELIAATIKAANKASIPVCLCGEMAGDVRYTRLLLALGLRDFSMPANALLEVKNAINLSTIEDLRRGSKRIMRTVEAYKQHAQLDKLNRGLQLLES